MPEVIRLRRVLQFLELVERVHRFVAEELEELTMEIVRSALGGDGHDAPRALPELCRDLSRVYCKFPNRRLGNVLALLAADRRGVRESIHQVAGGAGRNSRADVDGASLGPGRIDPCPRQQQ